MEKSKFEGLTRHNVAFRLNNKFHSSFAVRTLQNFQEPFNLDDVNRKKEVAKNCPVFMVFSKGWYPDQFLSPLHVRLQISDLVPFLEYLGCKPKVTKETLDQIDKLHAEETTDYVTSKTIGPDEPMQGRSDED